MSSCLIIKPALSRSCELYYNRYLHTPSACVHAHIQPHVRAHTPPPRRKTRHSWRAAASKAAVSHLALSPSSFPRFLFLASVTSHVLFFPSSAHSLVLPPPPPLRFPRPISFSPLPLSLLYLHAREDAPLKKSDVFFSIFIYFHFHLAFLKFMFLFFFCSSSFFFFRGEGNATSKDPYHGFFSVHQPGEKKKKAMPTLTPPPPPNPSDSSQPASPTPASFLIN